MFPVIFDFGTISIFGFEFHPVINSYGFMLMMAFYSCYYFLNKDLNRLGYDAKLASDIVFAAAVGGILGSKIYYLIENFERVKADPTGMIFSGAGLVFLGGLMGGTLGVTYVIKKNELDLVKDNEDGKVDLVSIEPLSNSPKDIISQNTSTLVIKTNNQTIDDLVEISVAEEEEKSTEFNFIDLLFVAGISVLCGVLLSLIFIQLNKNRRKTVVYDFEEAPSSGPETQALPSGLSIKNNKDEQELDLASTYIEMGELEQAHIILRNIVKKSENKAAKEKASELISLIQSK